MEKGAPREISRRGEQGQEQRGGCCGCGEGEQEEAEEGEEEEGGTGKRARKGKGRAKANKVKVVPDPPQPATVHPVPATLPNLGYACLCATLREHDIFTSRDTNKAGFQSKGLPFVSRLAAANARDLLAQIHWNEAHGIRLFRLSSGIFPWMSFYTLEELPDAEAITQSLVEAGAAAKCLGHRLTFHPSEFTKIASDKWWRPASRSWRCTAASSTSCGSKKSKGWRRNCGLPARHAVQ